MKLFIDEDLSPSIAHRLRTEDGVNAAHVRDRKLLSRRDSVVLDKAYEEDRILVTANVKDFQRLARARELHPGIKLVLDGQLTRDEQLALVRRAIRAIEDQTTQDDSWDMVNRVLEISMTELDFYELPEPTGGDS